MRFLILYCLVLIALIAVMVNAVPVVDSNNQSYGGTSVTAKYGYGLVATKSITLINATVDAASGCNQTELLNGTKNVVATINGRTGNNFVINQNFSAGDVFYLSCNKMGSSYTLRYVDPVSPAYVIPGSNVNWTKGINGNSYTDSFTQGSSFVSVTTEERGLPVSSGINLLNPLNNTYNNTRTNILFTFRNNITNALIHTCFLLTNESGTWTTRMNSTPTTNSTSTFTRNFTLDGTYSWNVHCNLSNGENATGQTNYSITLDTASPTIQSGIKQNLAIPFNTFLQTSINASDNNLLVLNITDSIKGQIFYSENLSSLTNYQYNLSLNASDYSIGEHTLMITVKDGHTAKEIKEYKTDKDVFDNGITYEFETGWIRINPEGVSGHIDTEKKKDRYTFKYYPGVSKLEETKSFIVESSDRLVIVQPSEYPGHIVVPSLNKWIDFNLESEQKKGTEEYVVSRISENSARVTIRGYEKDMESLAFESIGDLNVAYLNVTYYIINTTNDLASSISEGSEQTITYSVYTPSPINSYVNNVSAKIYYNSNTTSTSPDTVLYYPERTDFFFTIVTPNISGYVQTLPVIFSTNVFQNGSIYQYNFSQNQNVEEVVLAPCSGVINITTLTINGKNEENYDEDVNITVNLDLQIQASTGGAVFNSSVQLSGNHTYDLCLVSSASDIRADATLEYYGVNGLNANRKYYLYHFPLNATGQVVNLYTLNSSIASDIAHVIVDRFNKPQAGTFIKVQRYYPELGQSYTVEIGKADAQGIAGVKQVLADPLYWYIIQQGTQVVYTSNPARLLSTTKTFVIGTQDNTLLSNELLNELSSSLTFNNLTNTFMYVWNDATGVVQEMCLEVIERTASRDRIICSRETNCLSANAGNLNCVVGDNMTGRQYVATVYYDTNTAYSSGAIDQITIYLRNYGRFAGKDVLFGGLVILGTTGLTFAFGAAGLVIGTLISFMILAFLQFNFISITALVTLVVIGGIIIARLRQ